MKIMRLFVATVFLVGCAKVLASKLPTDLQNEEECIMGDIEKGVVDPSQWAQDCTSQELAIAIDIGELLLKSPSFSATHPAQATAIRLNLPAARLKLAPAASSSAR